MSYLQLAENVWVPERRRCETRVVCNCGRADDPAVVERLRKLAASILRRCSPEAIAAAANGDLHLVCAWPYGEVYGLQALWQSLRIDQVIRIQAQFRHLGFDVERALFASNCQSRGREREGQSHAPAWRHVGVHRWRYAQLQAPARALPAGPWWDAGRGLGACGDALGGGGVEGAWLSGRTLATAVLGSTLRDRPASAGRHDRPATV